MMDSGKGRGSLPFEKFWVITPVSLIDTVRSRKSTECVGLVATHSKRLQIGPKLSIASCSSSKFPVPLSMMMKA